MPDVTFRSGRFSRDVAPEAVNDQRGHDVAGWLRGGTLTSGYTVSEVIAEDYGWGFWVTVDDHRYWITVTEYEPSEDETPPLWLVGVHDNPGCLFVWLGSRPKPGAISALAQTIHTLLVADHSVSEISWWSPGVRQGDSSPAPPDKP